MQAQTRYSTYRSWIITGSCWFRPIHLGFASDYLSSTSTNLESALGRIEDVDLAEESANFAALTLRYEAAAAAVAQANASADTVFNLLMGSLGKD